MRLQQLFGRLAVELGERAEIYVDEALNEAKTEGRLPSWLSSWQRQEKWSEMDKKGVDFMFQTDVGPIFLQVKSSDRNALRFQKEHPNSKIRTVVVDIRESNLIIFAHVIEAVTKQRDEFLELRATPT